MFRTAGHVINASKVRDGRGAKAEVPAYSMIPPAMENKPGVRVTPSSFAVLKFTTNLNLVGSATARPADLAPEAHLESRRSTRF